MCAVCRTHTWCPPDLHECHEELDHLIVLLKVVAVSIQGAVSIKRDQTQRLSRRMDLVGVGGGGDRRTGTHRREWRANRQNGEEWLCLL